MAEETIQVTFNGGIDNARLTATINVVDPASILELQRVEAEVEADRAEVATNTATVAVDRLATEKARDDAQALYGDLDAVEAARVAAEASELAASNSETASAGSAAASEASRVASKASEDASALSEEAAGNSELAASNSETESGNSAAAALESENQSEAWANTEVDVLVPGGDLVDDYSALHHATKAKGSEIASAASEAASAVSASNAGTSETNAAASEASALNAKQATQNLLDQFGDQYLGALDNDPTTDNNGNPLNAGDVYWNTVEEVLKFYTGTTWVAPEDVASTAASNAEASATASAGSAAAASASEGNAGDSATFADARATDSANSAAASAASENNAGNSAAEASASETNAAGSASAASASETNAETLFTDFQERYWGAYASEPALSPNGNEPSVGDLYYNTTGRVMYVFDGPEWRLVTTTVEGVYLLTEETDVAGQDTFELSYDEGLVQVLYNGVQLASSDFTATNGTSVVLAQAVEKATDIITFIRWGAVTQTNVLGTAATADKQTSPTDTTAGALMAVGAFGLGNTHPTTVLDLDDATECGFYRAANSAENAPPGSGNISIITFSRDPDRLTQIASYHAAEGILFFRQRGSFGWSEWQELYHTGNIIGTVSQSGGVPTGAIIERGSNSNGEYIKFADGTLICQRNYSTTIDVNYLSGGSHRSADVQLPLPHEFALAVSCIPAIGDAGQNTWSFSVGARSTVFRFRMLRVESAVDVGISGTLYAIGKWY